MSEKSLKLNRAIRNFIADKTNALDFGCGTGSLALSLSDKCGVITGIDSSPRMIAYAKKHTKPSNVEFLLINRGKKLSDVFHQKFDYIIFKMVIHENPEEERITLINEAKKISAELIIVEWTAPQPNNINGIMTWFFELIAAKEHFSNFKQWHTKGGLDGFLDRSGLIIVQEEVFKNKTGKIVRVHW